MISPGGAPNKKAICWYKKISLMGKEGLTIGKRMVGL